jgi:dolichol-phosphate mannosyltransferase
MEFKDVSGRDSDVIVLIATLNEERGLGPTVREIKQVLDDPHILVVDGNSTDKTVKVARELGLEVIMQRGRGKGCAIGQALNHVNVDPSYLVLTDADFTYPAEYIPLMIRILVENPEIGMVAGNRFDKRFELAKMRGIFYAGNRFLALAQHFVNGIKMTDPLSGLRVVRWNIVEGWRPKSKGFDLEAELNYLVERKGYGIKEIPIDYRKRLGEKKLKLRHGLVILSRIVTESLAVNS